MIPSLKQLCLGAISSINLAEYNSLIQNYTLCLKNITT
jgi:hypothetical protein